MVAVTLERPRVHCITRSFLRERGFSFVDFVDVIKGCLVSALRKNHQKRKKQTLMAKHDD